MSQDNPQQDDSVARRKEEFNLALRFIKAVEHKLDQLKLRESNFKLDEAETKFLREINNTGLLQGVVAGVLTLVTLRRIRSGFLQRLQRDTMARPFSQQTTTTTTLHAPKSPFMQKPPVQGEPASHPLASIAEGARNRRSGTSGTIFNLLSWMVDGTVSFYVAVFVSLRNPDDILQKVSEIPLVEGRSKVADELCPEFLQELRIMQEEFEAASDGVNTFQREALQNPRTPTLKALLKFCHNCQQRAAYEKLLRQENGLPTNAPVSIPSPGVPHNHIPSSATPGGNDSVWGDEQQAQLDFYDTSQDTDKNNDWADPFVTDQEEDQEKEERRGK